MKVIRVSENEFHVFIYEHSGEFGEYLCGSIFRNEFVDEESDLAWWMFYSESNLPLSCRDLNELTHYIGALNSGE